MGFLEALTIVFIALKLTGVIAWSWWVILIPMYPAVILYAFFITTFVISYKSKF